MPVSYYSYIPTIPHIIEAGHKLVFSQHDVTVINRGTEVMMDEHS
jgi:hypothetical protein